MMQYMYVRISDTLGSVIFAQFYYYREVFSLRGKIHIVGTIELVLYKEVKCIIVFFTWSILQESSTVQNCNQKKWIKRAQK